MNKVCVDYHYVAEGHETIHTALENWARWVRVKPSGWQIHPMFREYRSHAWQWHRPEPKAVIDTLAAHEVEKAVAALPEKHRDAVRWCYVFKQDPIRMARRLAVSREGLMCLISDGRTMLKNRGYK